MFNTVVPYSWFVLTTIRCIKRHIDDNPSHFRTPADPQYISNRRMGKIGFHSFRHPSKPYHIPSPTGEVSRWPDEANR
jgi:hypothetical protein